MNRLLIYAAVIFLVFLLSCRKDSGKLNFGNYPADIGAIVSAKCAVSGCHNALSYKGASSFDMSSWQTVFEKGSSNGSPVIPYNIKFSSLCYFINSYPELGPQNTPRMPFNQAPLSYSDVKKIQDWIASGAPDANGNVWASVPSLKKLYAANQGCDVITVFDSETKLPVRFVQVGTKPGSNTPHQLKVSPDGKYWYVVFINNDVIQKFRCSDDSYVGTIPLSPAAAGTGTEDAGNWNTMVITHDSKRAYCVSWPDGKIAAVDLEQNKLLHYIGGQYVPHGIALNAAEDRFYVASQTGNFITEYDTAFSIANRHSLQNGVPANEASSLDPHEMVLAPDNSNLLITCQASNEVRVFNINTYSVTNIIHTGVFPQEIVYAKSTGQYFVSCTEDSTTFPGYHGVVTCINGTGFAAKNIRCGFQPHGLAVDETKKVVYVLSRNISVSGPLPHHTSQCAGKNGFVNFIDLNTLAVLPDQYELSVDPYYIFARP